MYKCSKCGMMCVYLLDGGVCKDCYVLSDIKDLPKKDIVPYSVRQAKRKKTLALIKTNHNAKRAAIRRRKKRLGIIK